MKRLKKTKKCESTEKDTDKEQFKQDWKLLSGMMKGKCKPKGQKEFDNFKWKKLSDDKSEGLPKKTNEDLEREILAMPNRIKEIEGELQNNAQKLFNMLADEYLDNDAKFDALLEERDALVKELCGCQKMNESIGYGQADRKATKDRIRDIVGPERADEVFEYWDRIQSSFNMRFKHGDFDGSVEKHLQRLADILGPEGRDIIDDINAKFTRQAKELSDWYDRMDREGRYTGD